MKAIYKITNKINNKVYIGQSVKPSSRWDYHINRSQDPIGLAIKKYGVENFKFEIIEWTENYNEKEQYWIDYYKSFGKQGYNLNCGGIGQSKLTMKQVKEIRELLKNPQIEIKNIAKKYQVQPYTITSINTGSSHYDEKYTYPIKKTKEKDLTLADIQIIEKKLKNSKYKTVADAVQDLNISRTLLYSINNGKHKYSSNKIIFPIIKGNILNKEEVMLIEKQISTTKKSFKQLAKDFNRDEGTISRINKGKHRYSNKRITFPIR